MFIVQSDQSNHSITNGIIDSKTQTVLTTTGNKNSGTHFMTPAGPIHLTAEECNEILMKRAIAAQQNNHTITTTSDGHHAVLVPQSIAIQVQKVIQGLDENEDSSQATSSTHCKLEPVMSVSPKLEVSTLHHFNKTVINF